MIQTTLRGKRERLGSGRRRLLLRLVVLELNDTVVATAVAGTVAGAALLTFGAKLLA